MECFGTFARGEAADLMRISRTTLTFTLTYRAVNNLISNSLHSSALLGVGVCAIIFISKSVSHFAVVARPSPQSKGFALLSHVAQLTSEVATQFVSNLVAVLLGTAFGEADNLWWVLLFAAFGVAMVWFVTNDISDSSKRQ
ncbi:MAG: hypothetical protein CL678_00760 [Bdellovibrionaceae bacterium]|nr:hypothetical protein [Pseudobdellovibrionaceae bacterium]|tara:strand:+ start:5927 stop:6349 length:423 start_codon:yes stop_codon:yes gene_type:complete